MNENDMQRCRLSGDKSNVTSAYKGVLASIAGRLMRCGCGTTPIRDTFMTPSKKNT